MIRVISLFKFLLTARDSKNIIIKLYIRGIKWISNMRKVGY